MMTSENNDQSNSFEPPVYKFPPWLEKPISFANIFSHIRKKGVVDYNDIADICSKYCTNLEQAKKQHDNISKGYGYKILDNLINDLRKEKCIKIPVVDGNPVDDPQIEQEEKKEKIFRLVEGAIQELRLELREQVVIRLKVYRPEKFTYREIAKIVGFSESLVRIKYDMYHDYISNYVEQGMRENA